MLKHVQMIAEGDKFLINEDIDFTTLPVQVYQI